ncbi:BofC C-terminal domain-containing protein [Paenibacillus mucilaginosus]|uniref:Bypass-of-forespore protein C n=3 Tax=Paenibacillus mucilaginosus TaxID=61624 RepID=H6NQF8_9BACL|nr:BofC C-terminal domain-containing protein [Paenibacillus mucilaginosus]AEI44942.1 bypass-of-forespore protein C (forespore regulator of the sigma-K checkpoint) [Paenibacillus mucilaginosus KNP414]AFC32682.1 bypass-of-forespore protein C [Paenibacillus mucilaginosus 3016]AFH65015.1 bypass-of-forespore protein C [Paenibacillus mucilaginosus K02]MCG7213147.1 BofC C-terminal domain-containing protein [Paenibacillus mucilaginosus]WDM26453.1 BofC C-terminal domain-containing protein [Paenibacillu
MILLNFWNQLKKQWKRKLRSQRRWLGLALILLAAGVFGAGAWVLGLRNLQGLAPERPADHAVFGRVIQQPKQQENEVRELVKGIDGQREAFVKKAYVCGEELQRIGLMSSSDILSYYKDHPALTVSMNPDGAVLFTEEVDDLSPQCKDNAYFGLDAKGNLSLFSGVPAGGGEENVIRTFFQLNIQYLESSLPRETVKQLYQGIRVRDLDDYNSVLSTLSDYAVEETEKVMQVQPGS